MSKQKPSKPVGFTAAEAVGIEAAKRGQNESDCPFKANEIGVYARARRRYWLKGFRSVKR